MDSVAWQGPPNDALGHPAQIQPFVIRTDNTVIALQSIIAYHEGCILNLHLAVRRGSLDEAMWKGVVESSARGGPHPKSTDDDLKFEVRFDDGSKATTVDDHFQSWQQPARRPEDPVLLEAGNEYGHNDQLYRSDRRIWLWPIPQPNPFEFVIAWQKMGIEPTSTIVNGRAIRDAAEQATPYWT